MYRKNLLAPAMRHVLPQWVEPSTLFAFDFDGTLSPIVDEPDQAAMTKDGWSALKALAHLVPVAVISGRARENLSLLVPHEVAYLIGNHGSEGLPQRDPNFAQKAMTCAQWFEHLIGRLGSGGVTEGARIENKGVSLALHYRHCKNQALARSKLLARAAELEPSPRIIRGCCVINLLPEPAVTKRDALMAIMEDCGAQRAIFFGDDFTDELAFAGAPNHWLTVRVGESVISAAKCSLRNVQEVEEIIRMSIDMLQSTASNWSAQTLSSSETG